MTTSSLPEKAASRPPSNTVDRLVQDHLEAIYGLIYSQVGTRVEAEELTSKVFLEASRSLGMRDLGDPHEYLVQLAHRAVSDYWRAFSSSSATRASGPRSTNRLPTRTAGASPLPPAQRVDRILDDLPQRERTVLTERFLLGRSAHETAKAMHLSEVEVMALLYHAILMASELDSGLR